MRWRLPAGTPPDVVDKLNVEANTILHMPDVVERFRSIGSEPVGGTPAELEKFLAEDRVRWKRAVDVANLKKLPLRA